ncbi:hypothetical protein GHK92_10700 [Nocardioides sp. dk4132]|uniref:hypothetical protein n=1 Tax=unclassified Nocardioides TaxID=2615069 RepID=UPI00129566EE|nr:MULTISPECIES: hypothetical protein [unclassified Nocardioides]MQW76346.1 hypothetical protein [Nocardioides sp. dk4132]QGA07375.1 hypothetical protein GFH29_08220 [Nocardioides sp. dk884]
MRLGPTQVLFLRLGAIACLLGAVVTAFVAITVDSAPPGSAEVSIADDPREIALPDPGLFGSQVVVYGASGDTGVAPSELGCRLLTRDGAEQSTARMSELRVLSTPAVTVEDRRLDALFSVGSYPRGSVLACSDAQAVAPVALSQPSTFGSAATMVRITAALATPAFLAVGIGGLVLLRRRPAR